MNSKLAAAAVVAASLIGSAAYAGPTNLVMNGDFSATSYSQNSQFGTGYGGQGVTDWTGNGGYDLYFTSAASSTTQSALSQYGGGLEKLWAATNSPTGGAFVALDGDPAVGGAISQTINGLKAGDTYALSFSWAAGQLQSRTGATTEQLQASLGGQTFLTNTVANPSEGFTGWFTTTFDYVATGASETLSFLSIGTPTGLPPIATLDGVSLTDVAVPEPMSFALLGMGLAGLGFIRFRAARRA